MFEKRHEPLAPISVFIKRMSIFSAFGIILLAITIFIGMIGLVTLDHETIVDAFTNTAMIVTSVGVNTPIKMNSAKIFCGYYSLVSNFIYISVVGIIFAPLAHRIFHKFHLNG